MWYKFSKEMRILHFFGRGIRLLPVGRYVSLKVYNVPEKEIATPVNENKSA